MSVFFIVCFVFALFSFISDSEWVASIVVTVLLALSVWWFVASINYVEQKTVTIEETPIYSISTDKNFQLGFSMDVYKFYVKDESGGYIIDKVPLSSVLYMSDSVEPHLETIKTTYSGKPLIFEIGGFLFLKQNYDTVEYKIYVPSNTIKLDFDSGG